MEIDGGCSSRTSMRSCAIRIAMHCVSTTLILLSQFESDRNIRRNLIGCRGLRNDLVYVRVNFSMETWRKQSTCISLKVSLRGVQNILSAG